MGCPELAPSYSSRNPGSLTRSDPISALMASPRSAGLGPQVVTGTSSRRQASSRTCHPAHRKEAKTLSLRRPLKANSPVVRAPFPSEASWPFLFLHSHNPLLSLQASSQADDPLAPSHLEFKFEPEDFAFPSTALGPQAGLGGALRQEAWCALALA